MPGSYSVGQHERAVRGTLPRQIQVFQVKPN